MKWGDRSATKTLRHQDYNIFLYVVPLCLSGRADKKWKILKS